MCVSRQRISGASSPEPSLNSYSKWGVSSSFASFWKRVAPLESSRRAPLESSVYFWSDQNCKSCMPHDVNEKPENQGVSNQCLNMISAYVQRSMYLVYTRFERILAAARAFRRCKPLPKRSKIIECMRLNFYLLSIFRYLLESRDPGSHWSVVNSIYTYDTCTYRTRTFYMSTMYDTYVG